MPSLFFRRRYSFRFRHVFPVLLAVMLATTGCAPAEKNPGGDSDKDCLVFSVRGRVNNGSPLKITVLQLSGASRFLSAGYDDLQHDPRQTLPGHVRAGEEIFLLPGDETRCLPLARAEAVRYLGIFAEYKDIAHKGWRLLLPLPPPPASSVWTALWPPSRPDPLRVAVTPYGLQEINDER